MKFEPVPINFGTISADPGTMLLVGIGVIVVGTLLIGAKREVATFAIAAGVVGAILAT